MAETKGTSGCPRDGKLKRMDPPSSCLSISGISVCAIRLGLRRLEDGTSLRRMTPRRMASRRMSLRRMTPRRMASRRMASRRMAPRRRKAETEEDRDGCSRVWRCVFETFCKPLVAVTVWLVLSGSAMCECYWWQQWCVGGWLAGCVLVRAQERVAERACLLLGYTLDYWIVAILFTKFILLNNKPLPVSRIALGNITLTGLIWRMSPRRKTERDVPETDGTDGRYRRMSLRWKAKTDGPSVLKSFHLSDIRLCHSSWPSQSPRPRDGWRWDGWRWDGCPWDG